MPAKLVPALPKPGAASRVFTETPLLDLNEYRSRTETRNLKT